MCTVHSSLLHHTGRCSPSLKAFSLSLVCQVLSCIAESMNNATDLIGEKKKFEEVMRIDLNGKIISEIFARKPARI